MKEYFFDLKDQDVLSEGLKLWRQVRGVSREDSLSERSLLNLGLPLLRQWIAEEKERRNSEAQGEDNPLESDEDDDGDDCVEGEDEFVWTPEIVAAVCERIVRRATRHYIRSKWLRRLASATIQLQFKTNSKQLGKKSRHDVTISPADCNHDSDLRRVGVLLHELRRMQSKGEKWQITSPWPMAIPFWI